MSKNWQDFIAGSDGTIIVNDATKKTQDFYGIFVLEDTVFAKIERDGVDIKANHITTPGTAVKAGALITTTLDTPFTAVQLTSGSVVIVL